MKTMRIPRRVTIEGTTWDVKRKRNLLDDESKPVFGLCDYNANTLWIDSSQSLEAQQQTFIHEVLHALIEEKELELIDDEKLVRLLEGPLFRFLMSNGEALFGQPLPRKIKPKTKVVGPVTPIVPEPIELKESKS
jgi:hypothetical protein